MISESIKAGRMTPACRCREYTLLSKRKWLPGRSADVWAVRFVALWMEHRAHWPVDPEYNRHEIGNSPEGRRVAKREKGGDRATSTLKQEDWDKRLAWTAKVKPTRAWGGEGSVKKPGGGGAQSIDAGMEPSPLSPSSFLSDPTPFSDRNVVHLRAPHSRARFFYSNCCCYFSFSFFSIP